MRILLIKHPTVHFKHTAPPISGMPLGLLYVAASLQKSGHQVRIYDAIVDAPESRWRGKEEAGQVRMGATWEEIEKVIEEEQPDVVGIGNQYSSQAVNAVKTAEVVKRVKRNTKVIIGGPHATVMPSAFLYPSSCIDYAVMGEGELTAPELMDCLCGRREIESVKGIAYYDNGKVVINEKREFIENLDLIPFPAYELVDLERYFYFNEKGLDGRERYFYHGSNRSLSVITSRGCPFNCIFCSIKLAMGRRFRAHSVDYVLQHVSLLKNKFGIKHIHFEDDNLSFDMSRFKDILDGLRAQIGVLTWDTPNGVRADFLTEDILRRCKDSGCTYLRIGVESADEYVSSEIIKKHLDSRRVTEIAESCARIGIDLEAFYIIGFPGEKIPQMRKTVNFALTQARRFGMYPYDIFTATPLLGTELYRICQEKGYLSKNVSSENLAAATQGEGMIATADFNSADLKKLLRLFRVKRYFSIAVFFAKFISAHPGYIFLCVKSGFFFQQQKLLFFQRRLFDFLEGVFMFRYKNCVLRKIGKE